eukprot:13711470-Alexandrium_andersonii.AAC.1
MSAPPPTKCEESSSHVSWAGLAQTAPRYSVVQAKPFAHSFPPQLFSPISCPMAPTCSEQERARRDRLDRARSPPRA